MHRGLKNTNLNKLMQRILFTLGILLIYVIGRNIPLPLIDVAQSTESMPNAQFFSTISLATGGDISNMSLFVLGLGPYMSTMILWRFITLGDYIDEKKIPTATLDKWKNLLTFIIALIQSLGISSNLVFTNDASGLLGEKWVMLAMVSLFSIAGTFLLIWLGGMNAQHGFGNTTIIIVAGMLLSWIQLLKELSLLNIHEMNAGQQMLLGFLSIWVIFIFVMTLFVELSEQRLPLNRVLVNDQYTQNSYLPIKLNPAGGFPIMYALTVMSIPQYLFQALTLVIPGSKILQTLITYFQMQHPVGIFTYAVLVFALGIGFAYVNINPDELVENLQQSGDYISNVPSGKPTYELLSKKIKRMAFVGASWLVIATTIPWIIGYLEPGLSQVTALIGNVVILVTITFTIVQEMETVFLRNRYQSIFK